MACPIGVFRVTQMAIFKRTDSAPKRSFLARLCRDRTGNVFAMTAAAVVPMIGVVGGAIDASRMYMVRSRLQAACDSAVLAGRKAMATTTYTVGASEDLRAKAMFNFNFQNADFQTTGTSFNPTADANGKLSATAQTTIPMTLMRIFGFGSQTASVNCSADLQIPNIDVVFVLDVTGSMACKTDGTSCYSGSSSKIVALKAAAKGFYDVLAAQLLKNGANAGQIRYGFVPYDQAVRVTDLFKASPDTNKGEAPLSHLTSNMKVQSRTAVFEPYTVWVKDTSYTPQTYNQTFHSSATDSKQPYVAYSTSATQLDQSNCDLYSANKRTKAGGTNYDMDPNGSILYIPSPFTSSNAQTTVPTSGSYYYQLTFSRVSPKIDKNDTDPCTRKVTKTKFITKTVNEFKTWRYKETTLDTSAFKTGANVSYVRDLDPNVFQAAAPGEYNMLDLANAAVKTGLTIATTKWNGCIEERDTTAAETFAPIPAAAKDLNYKDGGTSDDMRWRPIFNDLTWYRGGYDPVESTDEYTQMSDPYADGSNNPYIQCPVASVRNLNPMTKTDFYNYIDTLSAGGNTYLDVGMIWGLRLIAPQGMWGSRNLAGPNGGQISRHIIFLTDGVPVSSPYSYSAYGMEIMAERITRGSDETAAALHAKRFQALCDAQRGTVNIWAIAFGTSVTGNLSACADPNRAFQADNASDLNAAFENIAKSIADLRLVQ